jgi:hypothetical protein
LVILNNEGNIFLVIFTADLDDTKLPNSTPFIVCPMSDIDEINTRRGIRCDSEWISWPRKKNLQGRGLYY